MVEIIGEVAVRVETEVEDGARGSSTSGQRY